MHKNLSQFGILTLLILTLLIASASTASTVQPTLEETLAELETMAIAHEEVAAMLEAEGNTEAAREEWLKATEIWIAMAEQLESEAAREERLFISTPLLDPFGDSVDLLSGDSPVVALPIYADIRTVTAQRVLLFNEETGFEQFASFEMQFWASRPEAPDVHQILTRIFVDVDDNPSTGKAGSLEPILVFPELGVDLIVSVTFTQPTGWSATAQLWDQDSASFNPLSRTAYSVNDTPDVIRSWIPLSDLNFTSVSAMNIAAVSQVFPLEETMNPSADVFPDRFYSPNEGGN